MRITHEESVKRHLQLFKDLAFEGSIHRAFNAAEWRKDFGVSSTLFTFLVEKQIIRPAGKSRSGMYLYDRITEMTREEVEMLLAEMARWRKDKRGDTTAKETPCTEGTLLMKAKTEMLIAELRRRGYTGTLTIKKEITL